MCARVYIYNVCVCMCVSVCVCGCVYVCCVYVYIHADRMELHTLLNEEELQSTHFIVFINFMLAGDSDEQGVDKTLMEEIEEDLEIAAYKERGRVDVVGFVKQLKEKLKVREEGPELHGCCCN